MSAEFDFEISETDEIYGNELTKEIEEFKKLRTEIENKNTELYRKLKYIEKNHREHSKRMEFKEECIEILLEKFEQIDEHNNEFRSKEIKELKEENTKLR